MVQIRELIQSLKTQSNPDLSSQRDKEKREIMAFIRGNLQTTQKTPSTLIIFGQPGLGKTLIVLEIIRGLK